MFVLFKNILGGELRFFGQSKVMRLNTAETCTDSIEASEVSTSEAIEDLRRKVLKSHFRVNGVRQWKFFPKPSLTYSPKI